MAAREGRGLGDGGQGLDQGRGGKWDNNWDRRCGPLGAR